MHVMSADAERQTAFLLAAGAVLLPLQIWPPMPLAGMQLSDVFFALAFAQFVLARLEVPPARAALPIAAFAAGVAVSALFGGSLVKLLGHFMLAAIGWMAACASEEGRRWLRRALAIGAALGAATAVAGVVAFYAGMQTSLLNHHGDLLAGDYPRVRGTMVRANMMGSVVATGLILLWFEPGLVPGRWLRGAAYGLGAVALFFSFSRTVVPLAVVVIGVELWRRAAPRWLRLAWVGAGLLAAAALWITIRYEVALNPMRPWSLELLGNDGSRYVLWRLAVETLTQNPLFGAGPGVPVSGTYSAHNTWLNLWAGLGVAPLVAFAVLLLAAFARAAAVGAPGLACALAVALADSVYTDIEDMRHVWLLIGLALARAAGLHLFRRRPPAQSGACAP